MIVDIYKRPEERGDFSYLAVPSGQEIPQEAISTDWINDDQGIEVSEETDMIDGMNIHEVEAQIAEKGYAISSVYERINIGSGESL